MTRALPLALLLAACTVSPQVDFSAKPPVSGPMEEFYAKHGLSSSEGFIAFIGEETERAAEILDLQEHVPTMLCMWHRESAFQVRHGDDGKSFGVTQTLLKNEKYWREFWFNKGIELGSMYDPSTQVFFGVAEFSEKLKYARGDEFDAVRRYNGSGWRARRYARRVFQSRLTIYGYPLPETPAAKKAYAEKRHR